MRTGMVPLATAFAVAISAAGMASSDRARAADVIIGVGDEAPVHFPVGRAICRAIGTSIEGETCQTKRIEGRDAAEPLAVLGEVRNGAIEIGIVQSDWLHHAFTGSGPVEFMDVGFENLRILLLLHGEPFTVVARRDAGISKLADLAGKRARGSI